MPRRRPKRPKKAVEIGMRPAVLLVFQALREGRTQREAAAEAGVSPKTVRRWAADAALVKQADEIEKREEERKQGRARQAALAALADGRTAREAAEVADVGMATVYRWCERPEFRAALHMVRTAGFDLAAARLHQRAAEVVDALADMACDVAIEPRDRVKAARVIVDAAFGIAEKGGTNITNVHAENVQVNQGQRADVDLTDEEADELAAFMLRRRRRVEGEGAVAGA